MNNNINITKQFISLASTIFTSRLVSALVSFISFFFISRLSLSASYLGKRFGLEAQSSNIATNLFYLFIVFRFFNTIKTVITGILRGLHMTKIPISVSLLSNWMIGWPVAYIPGFSFDFGAVGISISYLISALISFIFMMWYWIKVKKQVGSLCEP